MQENCFRFDDEEATYKKNTKNATQLTQSYSSNKSYPFLF